MRVAGRGEDRKSREGWKVLKRDEQKRNSTEDLSNVYRVAASGELQSQNYRRNGKGDPIRGPPLDGPTEMQIKDVICITRNSTIFS